MVPGEAVLVAFGGLPGVGKTTLSLELARRWAALHLRIDTIEQAIRNAGVLAGDVGPAGYTVAAALAEANLRLGRTVVTDSVNPVAETRALWREAAGRGGRPVIEVELVCGDEDEHRRRVEARIADIPGLVLPRWQDVLARDYRPWPEPHLVIDTAKTGIEEALARIAAQCGPR